VVGGLLILFEMLLWFRKRVRAWRIGRAQVWMRAHIWLGLLCLPLLIYHSGFRLGGTLSTVLMVILVVVIVSGVWGLAIQQFLPKRMLTEVPSETIYSQIDHVLDQLRTEAERLVVATCGAGDETTPAQKQEVDAVFGLPHLRIGAVRAAGRIQGKVLHTRSIMSIEVEAEPLREFFHQIVAPYLSANRPADSPLNAPDRAAVLFRDLRTKLDKKAHEAVDALENLCEQ